MKYTRTATVIEFAGVGIANYKGPFEASVSVEVTGIGDADFTPEVAKELLVRIAIAITNMANLNSLAADMAPPPEPEKPPLRAKLERIK